MAVLWNLSGASERDINGKAIVGAKAYFLQPGTVQTPQTVYQDADLSTPHAHPVVADAYGTWPAVFFAVGVRYKIRRVTPTGRVISEMDGVDGTPAPVESGGGGEVDENAILKTGDYLFSNDTSTRAGFVRANGRSVGSASSGASERANADCEDLFLHLWDKFSNALLPVAGGRGSTAAADWAANKSIQLPLLAGRMIGVVEDMGGTAPNTLQVSTTITTTNASPTATVASATGLVVGMTVVSTNVPSGTTITAISGTTLTLSANASASASGTAARFSFFGDAQVLGASGGAASVALTEDQMPEHNHDLTDPGHAHGSNLARTAQTSADAGSTRNIPTFYQSSDAATTGITIAPAGGDQPHNNLPPTVLVGAYIKL